MPHLKAWKSISSAVATLRSARPLPPQNLARPGLITMRRSPHGSNFPWRARVHSRPWSRDGALWRQHLVRQRSLARREALYPRQRHRHHCPWQVSDCDRVWARARPRRHPAFACPLGSHPRVSIFRADFCPRQSLRRVRSRQELLDAGGHAGRTSESQLLAALHHAQPGRDVRAASAARRW